MHSGLDVQAAWEQIDRIDDLISEQVTLRLSPAAGLSDRLPHERRHRRARERAAALAGLGHHAANRQGLPQPAENQPGRARTVRRRLAGDGRFLPDFEPANARPLGNRAGQASGRRRAGADPLRTRSPRFSDQRKPAERCTTKSAGPMALLRTAQTISSEETMHLLSKVRHGN